MQINKPPQPNGQSIAVLCICLSTVAAWVTFFICRFDHDMKLLALGAVISQVSALMATASTMLVGRDFSSKGPGQLSAPTDLPAGSSISQTANTTIETPPTAVKPAV